MWKLNHHPWQFSLRAIFVLVVIASCISYLVARRLRQTQLQVEAVTVLATKYPGDWGYSAEWETRDPIGQWLSRITGWNCADVTKLSVNANDIDCLKEHGEFLDRFTHLRTCYSRGMTDDALQRLARIETLEHLDIGPRSFVSSQGIGYLATCPRLKVLRITAGTRPDDNGRPIYLNIDEGLRSLAKLSTLEKLDVRNTQVSLSALLDVLEQTPVSHLDTYCYSKECLEALKGRSLHVRHVSLLLADANNIRAWGEVSGLTSIHAVLAPRQNLTVEQAQELVPMSCKVTLNHDFVNRY